MDPISLIGGGLGLAAGIVGGSQASAAQSQALGQALQAAGLFSKLDPPTAARLQVELQRYASTGQMSPFLQQTVQQNQSALSQVQTDPGLRSAQLNALRSLQDVSDRGGRSLDQDEYLNKVSNDVNAANKGRVAAIQSSFAQRGMGQPGGLGLEAQMENAQHATQQQSDASMTAAAQAQRNALQAIQQAGGQAGQLRGQDFQQQATRAGAQDTINRFNTEALNAGNAANTQARNAAQSYNVQNAQNIANANTQTGNQQQLYNSQMEQQAYQNQLNKVTGQANAMNKVGSQYNNMADTTANMWGNIGQGLAKTGSALGQGATAHTNSKSNNDEEEG